MAKRYLLPCACGRKLEVDTTQAGLTLPCACGAAVVVPTLRGLTPLEPAAEQVTRPHRSWGALHGAAFVAALIFVLAAAASGYSWLQVQARSIDQSWLDVGAIRTTIEAMTPHEVIDEWRKLSAGLDRQANPMIAQMQQGRAMWESWMYVAVAVAALALVVVVAVVYLLVFDPRRAARPPARSLVGK